MSTLTAGAFKSSGVVVGPEEARHLIRVSVDDKFLALWVVALTLGLRRSEILGLTWSGIDFDKAAVRIYQGVQRAGGKLVIDELKSERSHRILPLPAVTLRALHRHRLVQQKQRFKMGQYWQDYDLIFCTDIGTAV